MGHKSKPLRDSLYRGLTSVSKQGIAKALQYRLKHSPIH